MNEIRLKYFENQEEECVLQNAYESLNSNPVPIEALSLWCFNIQIFDRNIKFKCTCGDFL